MNEYLRRMLFGMVQDQAGTEEGGACGAGAGAAGGAGGQGSDFKTTAEFKQAVADAVEAQTAGLKSKRDELIQKNNALKETLKSFDGIDPEVARSLASKANSEEEALLLKEGKLDQLVERRVDKMREKLTGEVKAKDAQLQQALNRQKQLEDRSIAATIAEAAVKAGGIASAIPDFVQRANGSFALTDKGEVIRVDSEGNQLYDEDAKTPMTADAWVESLKAEAPHLFMKANTGGAKGGQGATVNGKISGSRQEREDYLRAKYNVN